MKTARSLPLLLLLVAFGLCVVAAPRARTQASPPAILDNGFRNLFVTPFPPAVTPGGVAVPGPTGDPLRPAYDAQGQNGTAFGGFPDKGYGTLSPGVTPYPKTLASVPVPTTNAIPQNYPTSTVGGGVTVIVELRSAIIARPLAIFNISYNFGGAIPAPEVNASGVITVYRAEPHNSRLKTTVVVNSTNGVQVSKTVVNATTSDLDGTASTPNSPTAGQTTIVTIGLNPNFYWSKHAKEVYATQPGNISIEWQELADAAKPLTKNYTISTSPTKPERRNFFGRRMGSTGRSWKCPPAG